jgi:hypothetical protein
VIESVEQSETFPAVSVAVARKVVVESSGTETVTPGDAKSDAEPLAAAVPVQSEDV